MITTDLSEFLISVETPSASIHLATVSVELGLSHSFKNFFHRSQVNLPPGNLVIVLSRHLEEDSAHNGCDKCENQRFTR